MLLPGVLLPNDGKLPAFISHGTRVDFRPGLDDANAFERLVSGIRGVAPEAGADETELDIECPSAASRCSTRITSGSSSAARR